MLEQALPSLSAAVSGWFTPTALFVLLNLVIGTILVTSKGIRKVHAHTKDEDGGGFLHHYVPRLDDHHHYPLPQLLRSPSSVLERLKSIGSLYRCRSGEIPPQTAPVAPPAPATLASHRESKAEDTFETLDDAYKAATSASSSEHHFSRSQSDSHPTAGEMPVKQPSALKNSARAKSLSIHFEEEAVVRGPPATTRPGHQGEDEEVDAKADDFINRFRQQLNLQRLDSIMRYKDMFTGGR